MSSQRNKGKTQPQLNQQLAAQDEQRRRREMLLNKQEANRKLAGKLGDFSFDVAKLIIAGAILGGIMKEDVDNGVLIPLSIVVTLMFLILGVLLIQISNKEKEVKI